MTRSINRRRFLETAAVSSTVAPYFFSTPSARAEDANTELTIAAIGVGGSRGKYRQGTGIAMRASKLGRMVACCDVDAFHADEFNQKFDGKLKVYKDYRKLFENEKVDVVTIGTPDHWHTKIAIEAMQAGCDVYCEKPLTLTVDEGKQIRSVVEATGRVFQVGTQQRSENDSRFLKAVVLAKSGRLGNELKAWAGIGGGPSAGPFESKPAPDDMDWDLWLGPAPKVDYAEKRCHAEFRWWLEYSGGKMTDWGAHHIDIAQWALGVDQTGPVEVSGTGEFPNYIPSDYDPVAFFAGEQTLPNGFNTATKFDIDLKYANGNALNVRPGAKDTKDNGILIEGEKGRIFVNRGKLTGKPVEDLTDADQQWLDEEVTKLYRGKKPGNHMANFFECIRDRSKPISDVWTHHRTMTSCHLCNLTLLLGRKLEWDPDAELFVNDDQANQLLSRPQRAGFEIQV